MARLRIMLTSNQTWSSMTCATLPTVPIRVCEPTSTHTVTDTAFHSSERLGRCMCQSLMKPPMPIAHHARRRCMGSQHVLTTYSVDPRQCPTLRVQPRWVSACQGCVGLPGCQSARCSGPNHPPNTRRNEVCLAVMSSRWEHAGAVPLP